MNLMRANACQDPLRKRTFWHSETTACNTENHEIEVGLQVAGKLAVSAPA